MAAERPARQAELEGGRGVDRAQHPEEDCVTSSALSSIPSKAKWCQATTGSTSPQTPRRKIASPYPSSCRRRATCLASQPISPSRRYAPVDGHGMTTVAEKDHLRRTGHAVDTQHVKASVDRPCRPHPVEAERPNRALSSPDPNRVECRHAPAAAFAHWQECFPRRRLHLPPALQSQWRWTRVRMGTADQHALGIQAGRCGGLGRDGSAQLPAESNQIEAEQQHALAGVILQGERTREQIVMDLGGAPLEIDAVPGELDAERWRNGILAKPARPTSRSRTAQPLSPLTDSRALWRSLLSLDPAQHQAVDDLATADDEDDEHRQTGDDRHRQHLRVVRGIERAELREAKGIVSISSLWMTINGQSKLFQLSRNVRIPRWRALAAPAAGPS